MKKWDGKVYIKLIVTLHLEFQWNQKFKVQNISAVIFLSRMDLVMRVWMERERETVGKLIDMFD